MQALQEKVADLQKSLLRALPNTLEADLTRGQRQALLRSAAFVYCAGDKLLGHIIFCNPDSICLQLNKVLALLWMQGCKAHALGKAQHHQPE